MSGPGAASKVLCTHFFQRGWITKEQWKADTRYGMTKPKVMLEGYHLWAVPLVRVIEKSPVLEMLVWPVTREWSKEIARLGGYGKGSVFGKALRLVGEPLCFALGMLRRRGGLGLARL
jgi:hypothetical protein